MPLFFFLVLPALDSSLEALWSLELEAAAVPFPLEEPDFCPERVSAGVLVAFSCAAPCELMCDCALSSPVGLDVEPVALSLELVPDEDVLGVEDEELPLFIEALPLVDPVADVPELVLPMDDVEPFVEALPDGVCELL